MEHIMRQRSLQYCGSWIGYKLIFPKHLPLYKAIKTHNSRSKITYFLHSLPSIFSPEISTPEIILEFKMDLYSSSIFIFIPHALQITAIISNFLSIST
jgi:hypothetical protein